MKIVMNAVVLCGAALLGGCATVASPVGNGLITKVSGPITTGDHTVTTKTGEACATNVLGLVANGDASIEAAKTNGGITRVSSVDHTSNNVLYLFSKFCTRVAGE